MAFGIFGGESDAEGCVGGGWGGEGAAGAAQRVEVIGVG